MPTTRASSRGAYRHKTTETTGNKRKDLLREQTGLKTAEWRAMNKALDRYLGNDAAPARAPQRHRPHFQRWRITYSGPSLALAVLAAAASRAVERLIAAGLATKPDGEQWRDPWEGIGE
jgi:hypothetical protein